MLLRRDGDCSERKRRIKGLGLGVAEDSLEGLWWISVISHLGGARRKKGG